jgi:hypothetical protein
MGDRLSNEKPITTKNKEERHQRDEDKRPGSDQPSTDGLFQSHSFTNNQPPPECPLCDTKLTTDHILWTCKETKAERNRINITSEVWKGGKKEMEELIVKKIQLYNCI